MNKAYLYLYRRLAGSTIRSRPQPNGQAVHVETGRRAVDPPRARPNGQAVHVETGRRVDVEASRRFDVETGRRFDVEASRPNDY